MGIPENIQATEKIITDWIKKQKENPRSSYIFSMDTRNTNQTIGLIGLIGREPKFRSAEVWFKILADFWGKGIATEALVRILEFGFKELRLHRIEAGCATDNIASVKVLEKAGMIREGMKRKNLPIRNHWHDAYSYAILSEDFISRV